MLVTVLSSIGRIAMRWSRALAGTPKTVTIRREADGWYACISCADVPIQPLPLTGQETGIALGQETGIALGQESFATLADGSQMANPRIVRVAHMRLKRAQRRVSRRQQASKRRRKAVQLLAKAHQKVRRTRQDFHHQGARNRVQAYDVMSHEDVQVAHLLTNHHLAKAIADVGWSSFWSIRSCKAGAAGQRVVAGNPAFTSQACSGCGALVMTGLSVRWHACSDGGTRLHRAHNAARNLLKRGQALRGAAQVPQARTQPVGAYVA